MVAQASNIPSKFRDSRLQLEFRLGYRVRTSGVQIFLQEIWGTCLKSQEGTG